MDSFIRLCVRGRQRYRLPTPQPEEKPGGLQIKTLYMQITSCFQEHFVVKWKKISELKNTFEIWTAWWFCALFTVPSFVLLAGETKPVVRLQVGTVQSHILELLWDPPPASPEHTHL